MICDNKTELVVDDDWSPEIVKRMAKALDSTNCNFLTEAEVLVALLELEIKNLSINDQPYSLITKSLFGRHQTKEQEIAEFKKDFFENRQSQIMLIGLERVLQTE